jgi:hypothetical protein
VHVRIAKEHVHGLRHMTAGKQHHEVWMPRVSRAHWG